MFLRSVLIFSTLLLAIRLMGKRQLGELQPFEFAITILIANVASIPIADGSVSVWNGIVPIATLFLFHAAFSVLTYKSVKLRRVLNGKPLVIIKPDGVVFSALEKVRMTVNDLMSALRQGGYFTPQAVSYAVIETNGKISFLPSPDYVQPCKIPYTLVTEGKVDNRNVELLHLSVFDVFDILVKFGQTLENVLVLLVYSDGQIFLQPKNSAYITGKIEI